MGVNDAGLSLSRNSGTNLEHSMSPAPATGSLMGVLESLMDPEANKEARWGQPG